MSFLTSPRKLFLSWLLVGCFCATLGIAPAAARADNSNGYFRHGQISMGAKNYEQAYADFSKALEIEPDNVEYQIAAKRAQFAAATAHIQRGEAYEKDQQYPEAAAEMQRAMAIDPSNAVASQELAAINDRLHPPAPRPGEPVTPVELNSLQERLARAGGPVELGAVAHTLIQDFTVNSDPKNAYLSVGQLAGLNVIFDNSSQGGYSNSGHVSLTLHNLTALQILQVLNLETDSFYVPVTPNTILVANNSQQKHQQVDPTILKVFYIKNVQSPTDLTELAQAIRGLMQPQPHLMPVASINALVMRDTPDKVAMVQKLLNDLDKAPAEVVVNVRILQVNRDVARTLGLLPPTSFSVGLQAPQTSTSSNTTTNSNGSGNSGNNGTGTGTSTNSPTLNELTHLNSSNYAVTIPNATLNALMSNSSTKTIQEPQLRAVQGQKATLQIGQRIPIATGSFQPGIGGVGINPLVNTQFTYQPVGVNIDLTPQIQGDRSVLLKERIEISSVDSYANIGGISQPVFGSNVIDHTIDLSNGQSAVLGGMMINTVSQTTTGIPGFASIPLFKYLFSSTKDETIHNEILVVLTPHIVRSLDVTAADQRALYTGTQQDIQLRELPPAAAVNGKPSQPPSAPAAGKAAAGETPAPGEPVLSFTPPATTVTVGQTASVKLNVANAHDAYALTFQLNYDPKLVAIEGIDLGSFLSSGGSAPALVHREDASTGTAQVSLSRPPGVGGVAGSGTVLTLTLKALAPGEAPLTVSRLGARNPQGAASPMQTTPATITVR